MKTGVRNMQKAHPPPKTGRKWHERPTYKRDQGEDTRGRRPQKGSDLRDGNLKTLEAPELP